MSDDIERVERIAKLAGERKVRVVTSESLTSGTVATRLGAGPNAADWFGGGIVAYQEPVKFDVLGVEEGPVVTEDCARQMATGARDLLGADVAVSCTGVGGPEPSEGKAGGHRDRRRRIRRGSRRTRARPRRVSGGGAGRDGLTLHRPAGGGPRRQRLTQPPLSRSAPVVDAQQDATLTEVPGLARDELGVREHVGHSLGLAVRSELEQGDPAGPEV